MLDLFYEFWRKLMKSSGKTDTGNKRSNNQDSIFFSDTSVGPLPNLYIVADWQIYFAKLQF